MDKNYYQNRQNMNAGVGYNNYANRSNLGLGLQNPYLQNMQQNMQQSSFVNDSFGSITQTLFGGTSTERFLKGAIIGAVATYLITNENAQQTILKAGVKLATKLAGGVAEIKERFEDAKAEAEEEYMQAKEA